MISGYLITDLLIQEYDQNYRISVIQFYKRRIKRLYPALVGMLFVVVTVILLFDRDLIYNLRPIIETNLFYVYNFWSIGHGQSYFQQFGGASPFTHLWSLSIEGQFYLIWPLIVWGILRLRFKKIYVASALAFFSLISAITMAVLYSPTMINRVYYGTDTRLFAILLGTALAFVWPSSKLTSNANQHIRYYLNGVGIIALLTFCVAMAALNGQQPNTYYGLMYLISIVGTILVAVTAHPASLFSKLFDNKILAYLGTRSYSIYLYQLPIFVFYEKLVPNYQPNTWHTITEVILVLFVSEISYRYIENIFRNGLKLRQLGSWLIHSRNRFFFALTITLVFFLFIAHGLADKRANQDQPQTALQQKLSKNKKEVAKRNKAAKNSANQSTVPSNKNQTSTDDKKIIDTYALNGNQYLYFKKCHSPQLVIQLC
ncbi:hypothetical protein GCM10025879_06330 [Leuconostoc litchii]|nr:hypothetical protein GCM10025879_06330 [Leuconostoc litchii]